MGAYRSPKTDGIPKQAFGLAAAACLWTGVALGADISPVFVRASDTSFSRPHDLVLSADGRFLYVADVGNDVVKVLDPETLETLGSIGAGDLSSPHDVAFDGEGRLLIADTGNDRTAVYAVSGMTGRRVDAWDRDHASPEGVSPGPENRVYVTNAGADTVLVLRRGEVIAKVGSDGDGPNQYRRPHDIEVDGKGRVIVVDPGNNRIQILDAGLRFVRALHGPTYDFNEPKYVAVDEQGWMFVADEYNSQIKILDDAYRLAGVIGTGAKGSGPGQFNQPEGVEVAGGRIWISDTYNNRIVLYRR